MGRLRANLGMSLGRADFTQLQDIGLKDHEFHIRPTVSSVEAFAKMSRPYSVLLYSFTWSCVCLRSMTAGRVQIHPSHVVTIIIMKERSPDNLVCCVLLSTGISSISLLTDAISRPCAAASRGPSLRGKDAASSLGKGPADSLSRLASVVHQSAQACPESSSYQALTPRSR